MATVFKLYDYARLKSKDLNANKAFWRGYVKKYMHSMGRSSGLNVHRNKWVMLTMFIMEDMETGDKKAQFIDALISIASMFAKQYKIGYLRTMFSFDIVKLGLHAGPTTRDQVTGESDKSYQKLANIWHGAFNPTPRDPAMQSQETWWNNWLSSYSLEKVHCGHYEHTSYHVFYEGNDTDHSLLSTVCQSCAAKDTASGVRIHGSSGRLILSSFAVEIHGARDNRYIADRRVPGFTYNEDRMIWVDRYWTPYGDLLGSYHSSRNRGFNVIDSAWFRQNRRAFGIELEVQVRNGELDSKLAKVHEALNYEKFKVGEYCYFERDGSIGEGFEIVTQPAGLDVHRDRLSRFLNNSQLKMGLRSHEGGACGLHIHVGREFLTQGQIYRVQSWLNDVRNEGLIRSIARRYDNNYCRFKPQLAKFTVKHKHSTERYEALNVTNVDTIEFRIFRGSLRYESVIAALEFVNSLLTFCTPGEVSLTQFTAVGFKQWLMQPERKAENRVLRSYLSLDGQSDNEQRTTQASAA
jgi:hypothetical protein